MSKGSKSISQMLLYSCLAALATGVATRRSRDGQTVTMDGNEGIVEIPEA